ncbi:uncharacterized protein K452DRAFT_148081 [Aplosporella prunicola CBS 121167]|uniref:Serine hydrolase domain-containing protein n=1 Tax=Aplosporella prunicola CBS 121167 TaxID=1176127 RepID=A0A6A6BNJ0_9PEZI|nr:uncharacterized protein K452DRAFT_148081 [Aplosporella prunicola CBS 121167]KAF2144835.1 hypothetical protein K452DRAFT_148081 [Aplosporella prunicola CBS 121167]
MTPRILCLHGGGASAAIFRAQCRNLVSGLRDNYELIFVNGPIVSNPGPGILPVFADFGPYYLWFSAQEYTTDGLAILSQALDDALIREGLTPADISGVIGFSQGAAAACVLLLQARFGDSRWARLSFAVLICGACNQNLINLIGNPLSVRSMHVHGLKDQWLSGGQMLSTCFETKLAETIEFQGGHHIPRNPQDIEQILEFIRNASVN